MWTLEGASGQKDRKDPEPEKAGNGVIGPELHLAVSLNRLFLKSRGNRL
jgi:hypothetical protein